MTELKVSADDARRIASGTISPVIRALLHDHRVLREEVEELTHCVNTWKEFLPKCPHCNGRGYFDESYPQLFSGQLKDPLRRPCNTCGGYGRAALDKEEK